MKFSQATQNPGVRGCHARLNHARTNFVSLPALQKAPERAAVPAQSLITRREVSCQAQPSNNQEPTRRQFNQLGFVRVRLERVTTTKQGHYGYLVFVRHEGRRPWLGGTERGLVVHITGDTLYCLCKLLRNEPTARPMPLDILSGILTQASNQSPEEWGIIRVAITSLQHDTYIARVYFGNRRTGEVAWEQDIRPSDATYLAEQWKVPFYIDSGVWHETAITHSELQESERDYELPFDRPADKESARDGTLQAPDPDSPREPVVLTHSVDSPVDAAGIRPADPELVKMLKRELAIAVSEEDYVQAAQLRDSPLMRLYMEVQNLRAAGDLAAALELQDEFDAAAAKWDFGGSDVDAK